MTDQLDAASLCLPERFDWVKFSFYRVDQKNVNKDTSYPMQVAYCFSKKKRYNDIDLLYHWNKMARSMDHQLKNSKTDDLKQELMETPDLDAFLEKNGSSFSEQNIKDLLQELFARSGLTKAELARRSGVSEVYLYQLFSGIRRPSRDRLIALAISMNVSLEEMQELLRHGGFAELYARDKRDAILIFGISHRMTLHELNDLLFDKGAETLI